MNKKYKLALLFGVILLGVASLTLLVLFVGSHNITVLNPKGMIATQQKQLILTATILMSLVVVPVLALTAFIAWRYRAGNKKATYSPELDGNRLAETVWWLIPFIIILALAAIAWKSSHDLDPYKPLASSSQPIKIQVVALRWKWLFMYPEHHIATVNFIQFPKNTPIDFEITADAPMNSFWIPQLGGQVYAMSGMKTNLHLMANELGDYAGSSANISGKGFAGMKFTARASTAEAFESWVHTVKSSPEQLTADIYDELAKPSTNTRQAFYAFPASSAGLYDTVVMKYMTPQGQKGY